MEEEDIKKILYLDESDEVRADVYKRMWLIFSKIKRPPYLKDTKMKKILNESQKEIKRSMEYHDAFTIKITVLCFVAEVILALITLFGGINLTPLMGVAIAAYALIFAFEIPLRKRITKRFALRRKDIRKNSKDAAIIAYAWNKELKHSTLIASLYILSLLKQIKPDWYKEGLRDGEKMFLKIAKSRYGLR